LFMRPLNFDTELQKKEHLFGNTNRCFCIFKSKNSLKKMGVFLMMFHVRQKSNLGKKIRNFYNVIYGFWSVKGVRGIFPLWAIFTDFPSWEICKKSGCGRPQAVLAILPCVMTQAVLAITPCVYTQAVLAVPEWTVSEF